MTTQKSGAKASFAALPRGWLGLGALAGFALAVPGIGLVADGDGVWQKGPGVALALAGLAPDGR